MTRNASLALRRAAPQRPLPRLRGRDREGAFGRRLLRLPPPPPPPPSGGGRKPRLPPPPRPSPPLPRKRGREQAEFAATAVPFTQAHFISAGARRHPDRAWPNPRIRECNLAG